MRHCQLFVWRWTWMVKERKNPKQYIKLHSWHAKSYKVMLSCGILIGVDNVAWHSSFLHRKTVNIVITREPETC